ncbi:helix-turn-helix transcriptional regulator [Brevirhabdus pacifica]|nr:LuxR family transcriptional regulator [Brevirhabdus pacifica]
METFIEHVLAATTLDDLDGLITTLRDVYEVDHLVYHSVSGAGEQYAILTYEDAWVDHYLSQHYERLDPVVRGCFSCFTALNWKDLDWSGRTVQNFLHEARDAGVGNQGLSVPVRGPNGQFALFSVNCSATDDQWEKFSRRSQQDMLLIAHYINNRAQQIAVTRPEPRRPGAGPAPGERPQSGAWLTGADAAPAAVTLSPREADVLTLLALGWSRAQAAERLKISEHTLRAYLESARMKLGGSNVTHAVANALTRGLIVV